jgi:hypothetical protein
MVRFVRPENAPPHASKVSPIAWAPASTFKAMTETAACVATHARTVNDAAAVNVLRHAKAVG